MNDPDKRKIDDPELNQDATYDKKAEEDFDNSDDFHKYDDTALDERNDEENDEPSSDIETTSHPNGLNSDANPLNTDGQFDGNINI